MTKLTDKINIAIDGFSSCGKSSFARAIANDLNYLYIDSGAMYRTVTLYAIENGLVENTTIDETNLQNQLQHIHISFENSGGVLTTFLNNRNVEKLIRGKEVSDLVSFVSKLTFVREFLVEQQQQIGKDKGVVMDGRDIGTVVFPHAEIKIYMTASAEIRAERRYKELVEKNMPAVYEDVLENIKQRDTNDLNRLNSPLLQAEDAIVLDNSYMSFSEQMVWFNNILKEKGLTFG